MVYGMNRGIVGFLMNEYVFEDFMMWFVDVEEEIINLLIMIVI